VSAARLLALGLAALAFGCVPSGAQQEAKQAAECLTSDIVRSCLAGIACSGPAEQCKVARIAYELSCLELCTKKPGEVSVVSSCIVDAPFGDPRRCADAGDMP
jgi:hypothetical protein